MKKNDSLHGSTLLALILIGPVLWLAVLIWPAVAHSQQETRPPTHYVIVVRNTSLNIPVPLIDKSDFLDAIDSIPNGLVAASGQIPLWRKPEPDDSISVVFAAAGKGQHPGPKELACKHHYTNSSVSGGSTPLKLSTYFNVHEPIDVEEHYSPSDIADSSSKLHNELRKSLDVTGCDLVANAYSEGLTLAKGLAFVEFGNASRKKKFKQFFLLVFDFASPAYGSTEFNADFHVSHEDEDLAPEKPEYFIASIGSLKFTDKDWRLDLINYLDYPNEEPGTTNGWFKRDKGKFYPRLRFYRAVAHEANSDPFYDLADSQREVADLEQQTTQLKKKIADIEQQTAQLEQQTAQLEKQIADLEQKIERLQEALQKAGIREFVAWTAAAIFALVMILFTWWWWAIKGRFRRMAENHQKKLKSLLTSAVCIPDAPNTDQASESA